MGMDSNKPAIFVAMVIYCVLSGFGSLVNSTLIAMILGLPFIPVWMSVLIFLFSTLSFLAGIALLVSAYGLWTLQKWGWQLSLWIFSISIALGIIAIFPIFPGTSFSLGLMLFQVTFVVIDILCIRYLLQYEVKKMLNAFPYLI